MTLKHFLTLIGVVWIFQTSFAQQTPLGTWKQHPSFRDTRLCEAVEGYVYAASSKGFFRVHIQNTENKRLSAADGFHGRTISVLDYDPASKMLVIGYTDGYIDLLYNNSEITGIPGFYNKMLQGDKSILHACFNGDNVLLSTNFGILVVDMVKAEIRDSYTSIAPGGQNQPVLSIAISGDSIYAGIPDGLIAARYHSSVNLNDFNNWKKRYSGAPVYQLAAFNDSLFFYSDSVVKCYKSGIVSEYPTQGKEAVRRIKVYQNDLYIFRPGAITGISTSGVKTVKDVNLLAYGTVDRDGFRWFTTGSGPGVIKMLPNGELAVEPNGPSNNSVFAMSQNGDQLFTSAGGVTNTFGNAYNPAGFYIYDNYWWTSNPQSTFNTGLYDYTFVHYNPVTSRYYIATHTNGMLEFSGTTAINKYDDNNTPLFRESGSGFIRVSGVASDKDGRLWINNYQSSTPLLTMSPNGSWTAITLAETRLKGIVIDDLGYKWMIVQSGGVLVFDDNGTPGNEADDRTASITTSNGLITNDVLSLKADKNGYIWIGTSQGLNVVTNTLNVFDNPKAERFIIEKDGVAGYLLGEETINDICVDGGNRKWFATNNGAFLVDPNGQNVIGNFRSDNSPLPDNKIYCIGQVGNSGEIFFGTEAGIASYRSDASEAGETFSKIKIYPNPVRPGYDGPVTIEGLARDAEIRITDATGVLVYQTTANGGTAVWNQKRLDGSSPSSGVYYVFGINSDGTETAMGKFVFIR